MWRACGPEFPDVGVREGDIFDPDFVRSLLRDVDVLITSVRMKDPAQQHRTVLELHRMLMDVVAAAGVRWIAMGGAGSLEVAGEPVAVGQPQEVIDEIVAKIPFGRMATPQEMAGSIFLLCTPWSDWVTGQVLHVGGGQVYGM